MKCNIHKILKDKGKDILWLSRKTRLSKGQLYDIANVRYNDVSAKKAYTIAKALGKSIEEVWEFEEESKDDDSGSTT